MKVFVYFNLHKKVWSIKALEGPDRGRVIQHADSVTLYDARPRVSQAGRRRVIREQRKNVHAGIVGQLMESQWKTPERACKITYNPYKYETFVYTHKTDLEYLHSNFARLTAEGRTVEVWNYDPEILYKMQRDAVEGTWEDATC